MTITVLDFPKEPGAIILKNLAKGAVESAQKLPERWWPKRQNDYPVTFLSKESCTLEVKRTQKELVEFTFGIVNGEEAWCLVVTKYDNVPMKTSDFVLCLPN